MAESSKAKGGRKAAGNLSEWHDVATRELRGKPLEELAWQSPDGLSIRPLYTAAELEGLEHHRCLMAPGLMQHGYPLGKTIGN